MSRPLVAFLYGLSANWDDPKRLRCALRAALPAAAALATYLWLRWVFASDLPSDARQLVPLGALGRFDPGTRLVRNGLSLLLRSLACGSCPIRPFYTSRTFWLTSVLCLLAVWHAHRVKSVRPALRFGLGLIVVGYAPFALYTGYTDRFAYFASAGFSVALAALVTAAIQAAWATSRRQAVLVTTLAVVCGALWLRQLRFTAEYWREAGRLADTLLARLVQTVPDPPAEHRTHVFGIPTYRGDALVFPTYFSRAARLRYQRSDLHFAEHYVTDRDEDKEIAKATREAGYVVRWDGRDLIVISRPR